MLMMRITAEDVYWIIGIGGEVTAISRGVLIKAVGNYVSRTEGVVPGISISIPEMMSYNLVVDQTVRRDLVGDAVISTLRSEGLIEDQVELVKYWHESKVPFSSEDPEGPPDDFYDFKKRYLFQHLDMLGILEKYEGCDRAILRLYPWHANRKELGDYRIFQEDEIRRFVSDGKDSALFDIECYAGAKDSFIDSSIFTKSEFGGRFEFRLDDGMRKWLSGFQDEFHIACFQDLELWKGDKCMFYSVTHEGIREDLSEK